MILELLELVLYNTYIRFWGRFVQANCGNSHGGNSSPFIADLIISHLEYKYMMDKINPINLKHALSNNK